MNVHISILIMVKNEEKRIHVTLESIRNFADSLTIFDTGSTDSTVSIIEKFSHKTNIPLRLIKGDFVDFSTSRNVLLEYAETFPEVDYLLLLDCNDELKGGKILRQHAIEHLNKDTSAFLLCQEWKSADLNKYYNIRFIKNHQKWRYMGRVHEWIKNMTIENPVIFKILKDVVIFQDRTADDDKSAKRFHRDVKILLEEYFKNPTDARTTFYLAQSYSCIGDNEKAFKFYKLRTVQGGFYEEVFQSYLKMGELGEKLNLPWTEVFTYYIQAFEHLERIEPLIKIIEYYICAKKWTLAYTFANLACTLQFPVNDTLFVDKHSYEYKRWHLMGLVGWYSGNYKSGFDACKIAIATNLNVAIDTGNLEFYNKYYAEQALNNKKNKKKNKKKLYR